MASTEAQLTSELSRLEALLMQVDELVSVSESARRIRADSGALRFQLQRQETDRPVVAIIGGTGTGKSTLLNRLIGQNVSATSFRRTFTAGAVAAVGTNQSLPSNWLGIEHVPATTLPATGAIDMLRVATVSGALADALTLVDTPDLDGDQPAHHAQAERVFRWVDGVMFVVTPEKYQMTELQGHYGLTVRYGIAALFVMNKCEESAVAEDYARQLATRGYPDARIFAVARDGTTFVPRPEKNLEALGATLQKMCIAPLEQRQRGLGYRAGDLGGQIQDKLIGVLSAQRREVAGVCRALRTILLTEPKVNVSPITHALQKRMREKSVLYLIGPGRVVDRVRQVSMGTLAKVRDGWKFWHKTRAPSVDAADASGTPDFRALLVEEFTAIQSQMDDMLRSSALVRGWLDRAEDSYRLSPAEAGRIADDELDDLKQWLIDRSNATPRDTALLFKPFKYLPGAKKLAAYSDAERIAKFSELAPWVLTVTVLTHGAFFGYLDQMVLGGWSLATWVGERFSNEVIARTRQTNQRIVERFTALVNRQFDLAQAWLEQRTASDQTLASLQIAVQTLMSASAQWTEGA